MSRPLSNDLDPLFYLSSFYWKMPVVSSTAGIFLFPGIRIFYLHIIKGVNVQKAGLANPILLFPYIRLEDDFCCLGSVTVICRLPFLGWAA